ncbi:methyltransferase TRM13-domain-containing protein [Entophlyctis helioformis]|nr:methyltransferase TRM13-domain-containing protein [Entophlyctis helioformis]
MDEQRQRGPPAWVAYPSSGSVAKKARKAKAKAIAGSIDQHGAAPAPPANGCYFWVANKRRYCKLLANAGRRFCVEHDVDDATGARLRTPCPLYPKHLVATKDLDKHLLKCVHRPKPPPACFHLDVNRGAPIAAPSSVQTETAAEGDDGEHRSANVLATLPREAFDHFVAKLNGIWDALVADKPDIPLVVLGHAVMADRLAETHQGKHALQQASLLGHLEQKKLLEPNTCYVEYGCGKGEMTRYVHMASPSQDNRYILIDRRTAQLKLEYDFRKQARWECLTMDIKDLDLTLVADVTRQPIVAVSKHLCGVATDLSLRSIERHMDVHGICNYRDYVNREYLQRMGVTPELFRVLAAVSTWLVCGAPTASKSANKDSGPREEGDGSVDGNDNEDDENEDRARAEDAAVTEARQTADG